MNKKTVTFAAALLLATTSMASAQAIVVESDSKADASAVVGGTAGGATGAAVGGLVFGPIGAVIGGFAGATIGASAGVEASSVEYVRLNPTTPVVIDGSVDVGYVVPAEIELHAIDGDPSHGYFYTNDRVYFVNLNDRTVVYSPGTVVAVQAN
ncbi:MAG: hypothetical protein JWQ22_3149 [Devosia sp.]|nr:hypothetical protein [Devosia sp.]